MPFGTGGQARAPSLGLHKLLLYTGFSKAGFRLMHLKWVDIEVSDFPETPPRIYKRKELCSTVANTPEPSLNCS